MCDLKNELMFFLHAYEEDDDISLERGAIDIMALIEECDYKKVVRCKDCYHFEPFDCPDGWGICKLHNDSEWHGNDHCSYGCE